MVTPLDLVKCRLQVDQAKYKNVVHGFKVSTVAYILRSYQVKRYNNYNILKPIMCS